VQTFAKRDIAVVTRRETALAIGFPVGNRQRQHRPAGRQRRLQQRGMKMQQAVAIGRRSFREYGNMLALRQQPGDLGIDDAGVTATSPAQENGIVSHCKRADDRPVPDLFLGDECRRQHGVDHQDVQPGNMVGNQQDAGSGMGQVDLQTDAENPQKPGRPARPKTQATSVAHETQPRERERHAPNHQQNQSRYAVMAKRKGGFVQSVYPR